jgi:hypothetical protein
MAVGGLSPASQRLLREVHSTVADLCTASAPGKSLSSPKLDKLRSVVFALKTSIGLRQNCSPSDKDHETLWNAVCDLWVSALQQILSLHIQRSMLGCLRLIADGTSRGNTFMKALC